MIRHPSCKADMNRLRLLIVVMGLQGCVYLPRTKEVYDADCHIVAKHMEMQAVQIGTIAGCSNEGCAAALVAVGAAAAASAVVSGSIVVAGNVVYWFEKQGRCRRSD